AQLPQRKARARRGRDRHALSASRASRPRAAIAPICGKRRAARAQAAICDLCRGGARPRAARYPDRAAGPPPLFDPRRACPAARSNHARIGRVGETRRQVSLISVAYVPGRVIQPAPEATLDPSRCVLPVSGAEQAKRLLDNTQPANGQHQVGMTRQSRSDSVTSQKLPTLRKKNIIRKVI